MDTTRTTAEDLIDILKEVVSAFEFKHSTANTDSKYKNFANKVYKNYILITDDESATFKRYELANNKSFTPYEKSLVKIILDALGDCAAASSDNQIRFSNLAPYYLLQAIASFINEGKNKSFIVDEILLHQLISKIERWSQRTYEGDRTDLSFLIVSKYNNGDANNSDIYINDVINQDFIATLSDVGSSCIVLDSKCRIVEHLSKVNKTKVFSEYDSPLFFDDILSQVKFRFKGKRFILLSLLSNGEILIIRDGVLRFAKRRGQWRSFDAEIIERTLNAKNMLLSGNISKKIYRAVLDVSFNRTGGCLAIVDDKNSDYITMLSKLISGEDVFDEDIRNEMLKFPTNQSETSEIDKRKKESRRKALTKMIFSNAKAVKNEINITDLEFSRKLLQELMSIDGATVITTSGKLIAVGAIVSLPKGSESGGRTAAAKALAKLGAGIKISEDGEIKCYVKGQKDVELEFIAG